MRAYGSLDAQSEKFERTRDNLVAMALGCDEYAMLVGNATFGLVSSEGAKADWNEKNCRNVQQY